MNSTLTNPIIKKVNILFITLFIFLLIFGSGKNNLELFYSLLTFFVITNLFIVRQPIIFFTLTYHTIQATIKVFYAEYLKISINDLATYSENANLTLALILSCTSIIIIAIPIFTLLPKEIDKVPIFFNVKKLFLLYIITLFVGSAATMVGQLGGLFQILYKVSVLKWSIVFLIAYVSVQKRKPYLLAVIGFEIFTSILSYFSSFKNVLFVSIYSFLIISFHYYRIPRKTFIAIVSLSLFLGMTWQTIKGDYRNFLSKGETNQSVQVGFDEAYDKILELTSSADRKTTETVIESTIFRISYIDYLAECMLNIPDNVKHENGNLWGSSLLHVFQPRILFPNKSVIDDSEKTNKYTGINVAGIEQGTSISIGYTAESYIDFGYYLLFVPLILLGLLIGVINKKIFQLKINSIYCWSLAVPFYFQFYGLEMATEKILGAIILYLLIIAIIIKLFREKLSWLEVNRKND